MIRRRWVALAWILSMTGPVMAGPHLIGSADAPPLPAWVTFCAQQPKECTIDRSQPEILAFTPELRSLLSNVNSVVNTTVTPVTDQEHWGVADLWSYPDDGKGDCEDFQLLKRKLLIAAGLPRRALRMTVAIDEQGEGHAVLMVRTDRGDFILDNKTSDVREWFETPYTFVKRESADAEAGKAKWVFLTPEPSGTLVASASR